MTYRRRIVPLLVATLALAIPNHGDEKKNEKKKSSTPPVPAHFKSAEEAKPFPRTLGPENFRHPAQQKAYQVAREIPEVLVQQPCYCYCDKMGHGSLLHCHVDAHSAG
ncbi:MAG: hypothetical protein WD696_19020 [Bryobacteraceae bacterium]